jgi:asparagine synthetase B (glutamine-hydrolysing)
MSWTFERVFYGTREGLDIESMWEFLMRGYYFIPRTLFQGYYRAVIRVGEYDDVYRHIEKPFPDAIEAQRPRGRFALHLSGGFDSSILAKLYDHEDVDYIHLVGPESGRARALAASLKGTLHEIQMTPELYIRQAEEMVSRLPEPYAFEDIVYAYIASKKAKELGHSQIVAGDGGDGIFGGAGVRPFSRKASIVWKTIDPNRLLGLKTSQPYMHSALYAWSKTFLDLRQTDRAKRFAQQYCRQLGMPEEVVSQKKGSWAGSLGTRTNAKVLAHMAAVVDDSAYRWIREFEFPGRPSDDLPFRQYGLVKWLQTNYKEWLDSQEIREFSQKVRELNATMKRRARELQYKGLIHRFLPYAVIRRARRVRDRVMGA